MPGRFDEQAAGVAVAGLCDVPAVLLVAGGVLAGGDAQPRRELAGVREAPEVSDFGDQPQRGAGLNAAKRRQRLDALAPWVADGDALEVLVEAGELAVEAVEV